MNDWVKTDERLPTHADTRYWGTMPFCLMVVFSEDGVVGKTDMGIERVLAEPELFPYWRTIPDLPEGMEEFIP